MPAPAPAARCASRCRQAGRRRPRHRRSALTTAGSRARLTFRVTTPPMAQGQQRLRAVATSGGRTFTTGYQVIRHRDLPLRYLVREASALVSAMDVTTTSRRPRRLRDGRGRRAAGGHRAARRLGDAARSRRAGDGRPVALRRDRHRHARVRRARRPARAQPPPARLGARRRHDGRPVQHAGVRARRSSRRTTRRCPATPKRCPSRRRRSRSSRRPHAFFTTPEPDWTADFDGWIEQRGSKFFTTWDADYTPLVSSHDQGSAAAAGRLADDAATARAAGPTWRTRSTGRCRTACRARIVFWRI